MSDWRTGNRRRTWQHQADDLDPRQHLAHLVYTARTEAGLTQAELARRASTTQAGICAIENGVQVPGGAMLERIARALGGHLTITTDPA